jgi:hypothetical protein
MKHTAYSIQHTAYRIQHTVYTTRIQRTAFTIQCTTRGSSARDNSASGSQYHTANSTGNK